MAETPTSVRPVLSAQRALQFVADAGAVLSSSLDYEETLRQVAHLAVPAFADWCAVYIVGSAGEEKEITSGHRDPEVEAMLLEIRRTRRETGESESQMVAQTTSPRLASDVRGTPGAEPPEGRRDVMERLGAMSYMVVPLVARGRSIGALTLLSTQEGKHYTEQDLAFAQTLAARCALAIDNARLYESERAARVRADFLARAGILLDQTLDYERTLRAVADIAVPEVADWCGVTMVDDYGVMRPVVAAHVDPAQRELVEEFRRRFPPETDPDSATVRVTTSGQTEFVPEVSDEMILEAVQDPERREFVLRLGLRSVITAALQARGKTFGTLTLANTQGSRLFEAADVQLAEELARRAGLAIDNARLYTERSRIAHTLQTRLLPGRLPEIPHAEVAARYRAAGELNEVGGDFYDVFSRSEEEWVLLIGDVSGKGPEAAAATALARYALRGGTADDREPADGLRRLNDAMRADDQSDQYATAALAYVTAQEDRLEARLALAGHLPPMIIRADGTVESAGAFGTMLALQAVPELPQIDVVLGPGDVLLLYTDGVTEAGPVSAPFGEHGFPELLASLAGRTPQQIVESVERAAVEIQEGQPRDDIALLAVGLRATG